MAIGGINCFTDFVQADSVIAFDGTWCVDENVYLELWGPNDLGKNPKAPKASGWADDNYKGVDPSSHEHVGLRTDKLVVVDCDSPEAVAQWQEIGAPTYSVKTPRGQHFYYRWTPGSPAGPAAAIFGPHSGIDLRAGTGAQVVVKMGDGKYVPVDDTPIADFSPQWYGGKQSNPTVQVDDSHGDWSVVPAGRRNQALTALAGGLRRQGMSADAILATMMVWNTHGLVVPPLPEEELRTIAHSVGRYNVESNWGSPINFSFADTDPSDRLMWMEDMELPPPAEWYWRPYLPKGRLVLLDGSEGIGKGMFCAWLATKLAKLQLQIMWGSTEDDPVEDVQKRLLAAGYSRTDDGRVGFFTADPAFPHDIETLRSMVVEHETALLILDPGRSYLRAETASSQGFSYNNESDVRPGLVALNKLAHTTGVTILFVHHWNKNTQASVQFRQGGSGAFAQVVRHRITMAWSGPTDGGSGAFEVSKSNIGPRGHVHTYFIDPIEVLDTATFRLGEELPNVPDLGEWMRAAEEKQGGIEVDMTDEAYDNLVALSAGSPLPSDESLKSVYGLSRNAARDLLRRMRDEGLVRPGQYGKLYRKGESENASPEPD